MAKAKKVTFASTHTLFDVSEVKEKVIVKQKTVFEEEAKQITIRMCNDEIGLNASYYKHGCVPKPSSVQIVETHFKNNKLK